VHARAFSCTLSCKSAVQRVSAVPARDRARSRCCTRLVPAVRCLFAKRTTGSPARAVGSGKEGPEPRDPLQLPSPAYRACLAWLSSSRRRLGPAWAKENEWTAAGGASRPLALQLLIGRRCTAPRGVRVHRLSSHGDRSTPSSGSRLPCLRTGDWTSRRPGRRSLQLRLQAGTCRSGDPGRRSCRH
jgi:hypothetical protein